MNIAGSTSLSDFELTRIFFAIVALLALAHLCGHLFQRLGMPKVIGEIAGGFLLGGSVLGWIAPDAHRWLFAAYAGEGKLLAILYWIGLTFLLFISGFEIQKSISREDGRLIAAILFGATAVSFAAGLAAPQIYDFAPYAGSAGNMLALRLVVAIAVAVTSIPVISKIFIDLGIIDTRFAKIVLVVATLEDVLLWVALAVATGITTAKTVALGAILAKVAITFVFFAVALLVMPRLVRWLSARSPSAPAYTMLVCFFFAAMASMLGVNVVFGAFLAGVLVGTINDDRFDRARADVKSIALGFFIPIYFAVVGLKLDVVRHFDVLFFCGFFAFCVAFKALGTILATRLAGESWRSSLHFAAAMNARGGPGIVLATVAFDVGIINETFFGVLVVIAIATSLMSGYWFRIAQRRGWELERSRPEFRATVPPSITT
ncbi:MAG TPA: cation:proton antiporter [Thermoanaerobaculia bacterium]|nr:cation:proton antiporter [Thermoanaerobaculia bacterium]